MNINVLKSITETDYENWESLISDNNFFNSYSWILGLEKSLGKSEILIASDKGSTVFACPLWEGDKNSQFKTLRNFKTDSTDIG